MAHIETWYRCPCGSRYGKRQEAAQCAESHVRAERWAVSHRYKGKAVRIDPRQAHGAERAMQEAELSDSPEERKRQLRQEVKDEQG